MDVYARYSPAIRDYIYRSGWDTLRAVQSAAGDVLFGTDAHLLLCASTASGKTEAALFPIITLMQEQPPTSIGCLYIAPLKALINDQFLRLNDVCAECNIPVWHWHGDVSDREKKRLMRRPSGILQITPESLEAMLFNRHAHVASLFGDLRFIVIDEIHAFLRGDRGGQALCLIERLSRAAGVNPRRVGLSATVGDPDSVGEFLAAGTKRRTIIPRIQSTPIKWRLSMQHFFNNGPQATDTDQPTADSAPEPAVEVSDSTADLLPVDEQPTDTAPVVADPGLAYIFEHTRGRKCLIFSNSREECETVTATLRRYCEARHEPDRFLIHHGNLSYSIRRQAEERMRQSEAALTVCTTSTLELGIDIGRLERAFQIDAPATVSSFLQRMGRTGRRGAPAEMWFVMRENHTEPRALLPETIPWELLQGIAVVQLYLEDRWVEAPHKRRLPYSLLYHQTMATLASGGEMLPPELAARVLTLPPFRNVSQDDFRTLLLHLLEIDHIQRTDRGGLLIGLAGERVVNDYKFYAVFRENEEYTVRCDSEELGTIVKPPPVMSKIAIAGHVWEVEEVDYKHHVVYCHRVGGVVHAYFGEEPGDIDNRVLERMRLLLLQTDNYAYLLPNAVARLADTRRLAARAGLGLRPLVPLGGDMYSLTPWLGSYAFLALERFLRLRCATHLGLSKDFDSFRPYYMRFTMQVPSADFYRILREEIARPLDPMDLLYPNEMPIFDKYDETLPASLTRKGFAYGVLDVDTMKQWIMALPD